MPWTLSDVDSHKKGLSDKAKRAWVHVANSALRACKRRGGGGCDASAIRQANAAAGRISESMTDDQVMGTIWEALRVGDSQDSARAAVSRALSSRYSHTDMYAWISHMFEDQVVYELGGDLYRCSYEVGSDGEAALGDPEEVEMYYLDRDEGVKESVDLDLGGDVVDLTEGAVGKDGVIKVKVIQPGHGASGFYPAKVLQRDGPKVFKAGTHMFWDHPTAQEEAERPEGSLKSLAGVLEEDAKWESGGPSGPGLFARAKIFDQFRGALTEIAPYIGVSIRAKGVGKSGQVGGKPATIVEELKSASSVDFVTKAGAGGRVLEIFEAARSRRDDVMKEGGSDMDEKQLQALREAVEERDRLRTEVQNLRTENGRLKEALILRDAQIIVAEALNEESYGGMSDRSKKRVSDVVLTKVPVKDDKVDKPALREEVQRVAGEEMKYLSEATGGAKIRGLGGQPAGLFNLEESGKRLSENISRLAGVKKEA